MKLEGFGGHKMELLVCKLDSQVQKKKHEHFASIGFKSFNTPVMFPNVEFQYLYVEGINALQYIFQNKESAENISSLALGIADIIKDISGHSAYDDELNNIQSFEKATKDKFCYVLENNILSKVLEKIRARKKAIPITLTHGDLTFENIIVPPNFNSDNKVYLIDYHKVYYPSYYLDVAKLFQDIDGNWSRIRIGKPIDEKTKAIMREIIWETLSDDYKDIHNTLLVVSFARILPYAKSIVDRKLINYEIERFAEMI